MLIPVNRFDRPVCHPVPCERRDARKREHIIGVSVRHTKAETSTATVTVTANSRNSRPTIPPINSSGMNTATREKLIDTMVKPISPAPLIAASIGFMPSST